MQEPLRKIRAFGDRFMDTYGSTLDEKATTYIDKMLSAASRMQMLLSDLLSFSRVSRAARSFEPVDLAQTFKDILADLDDAVQRTGAIVEVPNMPSIQAIPTQMHQLFQNLVANAIKFGRPGETPRITIDFAAISGLDVGLPRGKYARISVTDNGIGFDTKYLDRIFVIFQRLHGKHEYSGSGIGLAIVKKIVDNHQGRIEASSTLGEGASFTVTLPYQPQISAI
jgi:two-component system, LuxR family, sensor kinase FixL